MKELSFGLKKKSALAAFIAAVIFTGVSIGYYGEWHLFYEMTFIANMFAACVLLIGAVSITLSGRDIPHFLYLDCAATLGVVFFVCLFFAPGATLVGGSAILHLVNPMLVFAFYITLCDARGVKNRVALTALIIPELYYVFMIVFGRITGASVYPYFDTNAMGTVMLIAVWIIASCLVPTVALAAMAISRRMHERRQNKTHKKSKSDALSVPAKH